MFTNELKAKIKNYVMEHRGETLDEYIQNLQLNCKKSAFCKIFLKMGLDSFKAPKKEQITESHREIRLIKAQEWVN